MLSIKRKFENRNLEKIKNLKITGPFQCLVTPYLRMQYQVNCPEDFQSFFLFQFIQKLVKIHAKFCSK